MQAIREYARSDAVVAFAPDGRSATLTRPAEVELLTGFDGQSTIEKMARFQGQGSAASTAKQRIDADFARTNDGWTITRLALA